MSSVRRLLTSALVVGATLAAAPASPASAVGTCRGEAVTLVGSPGAKMTGTEGRDVIVTDDATEVDALGGDDLICVTGAGGWAVRAVLGEGSDQFYGGPNGDTITAGTRGSDHITTYDSEPDAITGGGGRDKVESGDEASVNLDTIDLGAGDDSVTWRGRGTTGGVGRIDAGDGRDSLFTPGRGSLVLDNVAGRGSRDGLATLEWSGLETFWVHRTAKVSADLAFVGGPGDETVTFMGDRRSGPVGTTNISLGSGDDVLHTDSPGAAGSAYAGGAGRDLVVIASADDSLMLDLQKGRLDLNGARHAEASGFEDAHAIARTVTLRGTPAANLWKQRDAGRRSLVGPGRRSR